MDREEKEVTKREFFDRDYPAHEAYGRLWRYAKAYRLRIFVGVVCGMLTAGTLVPLFQVVQPMLSRVEALQKAETRSPAVVPAQKHVQDDSGRALADKKTKSLMREYGRLAQVAQKFGIDVQSQDEALGLPLLFTILIIVPLVALIRLGLVFLNHYCLAWAAMKTVRDIRCDILSHVQRQSMQFHGRIDVGQLMSRSSSDPQQVQLIIQGMLQDLAQAPFEVVVSVGFIVWSAIVNDMMPTLGMIVIGFPLFMVPVVTLSKVIRKWSRRSMEEFAEVGSSIHEILTCIKVVKAYNTENLEDERYREANDHTMKATLRAVRWGLLVGPAVETVGIIILCAFVVWCFSASVRISSIIPMVVPLVVIYKPLKNLSKLQVQIETGRAALARLWSVLDVRMELPERQDARSKTDFTDKIVFDKVTFRYDTSDHAAVDGVSFEIPVGRMVAVVGGTGSGKTTLSGLLARFYDPQSGRVTMDGCDLRDLRIVDVHRLVGSVQQETLLFNDTIENNIRYGSPEATHDEVEVAAKLANAHDFIIAHPEGYGRMVGEKGFALSGGERQRIAIARAILRNPPVLILDEATSALDTVTEHLVQEALNNLMKNRTVFAIAHRLSTVRNADLILVMDRGKVVERGTHEELFQLNGVYRKLCEMQSQN